MRPRFKLWLEVDDELVFSNGRAELLRAIDQLGSITAAAKVFGMSYRAAWNKLHTCQEKLGFALLETQAGGRGGGGAQLTSEAREFLRKYDALRAEAETQLASIYDRVFGR